MKKQLLGVLIGVVVTLGVVGCTQYNSEAAKKHIMNVIDTGRYYTATSDVRSFVVLKDDEGVRYLVIDSGNSAPASVTIMPRNK